MRETVIENPVINSAFVEPGRHFKFDDEGITNEIASERRPSAYFIPVAQPKKKGRQLELGTEWTDDRLRENDYINEVRAAVGAWRQRRYPGITRVTRELLEYWLREDRERRLFFCQIEAVETAIFLSEYAPKLGKTHLIDRLKDANEVANPELFRIAIKMATGSGKTVVMAMLIAWQALNKIDNRQDARFSDSFLIVAPGITIRDRLRVLLPNDSGNYYRALDVVPLEFMERLNQATVVVTNFHALSLRETVKTGTLTKRLLAGRNLSGKSPFTETPDQMVKRVCRQFGNKKNIIVINDEAHHCYRSRQANVADEPDETDGVAAELAAAAVDEKLTGDEGKEAKLRATEARVWINGLEAINRKLGLRAVYDLSATPFFLSGSGYREGTLFPWVVSDFSLVDAIECGIVKVPRVPVADDASTGQIPLYRHIWPYVKDALPKKGRKAEKLGGMPELPAELEAALISLYGNYEKYHDAWQKAAEDAGEGALLTPPVFIVVCSNTNVSKLVYDWIAGWEEEITDGEETRLAIVPGKLPLFSNVSFGQWSARPNTVLIDSSQLESGEAMSADFKKVAAREIDEFKAEYRERFPERDSDALKDEDLLREVMNTVGKQGRLGEQVKCVISVSMLTEGWDANTVTHVLGLRAFSTQLLCEQVVGRALRRTTYVTDENDLFPAEYAEIYGVPFSFIPVGPEIAQPVLPKKATRVRALPERVASRITFPRVTGYRYELGGEDLTVEIQDSARMVLTTADIPAHVNVEPLIGLKEVHDLKHLKSRRVQEVDFLLARMVYEQYFCTPDGDRKPWLVPQILDLVRRWRREYLICSGSAFPQMLLLIEYAHNAADKIYRAIADATAGERRLLPILQSYNTVGSTDEVVFDTAKPVYETSSERCHISHVVCDSTWEETTAKVIESVEDLPQVECYVKNQNLGFTIPYTFKGESRSYIPDFVVRCRNATGELVNLIVEVSGQARADKQVKVETAQSLWVPAVNNDGRYGHWRFTEITDPAQVRRGILDALAS